MGPCCLKQSNYCLNLASLKLCYIVENDCISEPNLAYRCAWLQIWSNVPQTTFHNLEDLTMHHNEMHLFWPRNFLYYNY